MDNAMEIFRILGICMIATLLSLLIKKQRPEFAMLIPITAAAAGIEVVDPYFSSIKYQIKGIAERRSSLPKCAETAAKTRSRARSNSARR